MADSPDNPDIPDVPNSPGDMDAARIAAADQLLAGMIEAAGTMWTGYQAMMHEGFTPRQSLWIIMSMVMGGPGEPPDGVPPDFTEPS